MKSFSDMQGLKTLSSVTPFSGNYGRNVLPEDMDTANKDLPQRGGKGIVRMRVSSSGITAMQQAQRAASPIPAAR